MPVTLNGNRVLDIAVQDQYSDNVAMTLHRDLGNATLASATIPGSRTVTLTAGHGANAGELLYFIEDEFFTETIILNVDVNTITLDRPLGRSHSTAATVTRGAWNMNVNGSVTTVSFHAAPPPSIPAWDIYQLNFRLTDNAEMDDAKFGGITGLTNGVLVKKLLSNGEYHNIGLAKSNGEVGLLCDLTYSDKAPAGTYGMTAKCRFSIGSGISVRLRPALSEEIILDVQDDLTGLTSMAGSVIGHVVI